MSSIFWMSPEIGAITSEGNVVLRAICPFCNNSSSFEQINYFRHGSSGKMIALECQGCQGIISFSITNREIFPKPQIRSLDNLPEDIKKYYDEGLKCISVNCPNGAVTLFRKVIHSLGIHYGVAKKNDDKKLYGIIDELHKKGHIVKKLKDALLGIKDIGNDGAHVNENEPDMEQANKIQKLIETVLKSTVIADYDLDFITQKHDKKKQS